MPLYIIRRLEVSEEITHESVMLIILFDNGDRQPPTFFPEGKACQREFSN